MTASDGTVFPGSLVTSEHDYQWVIREHGEEHIKVCDTCAYPFFSNNLQPTSCHGCWYSWYLQKALDNHQETVEALEMLEGVKSVDMHQTGGMCLALCIQLEAGYFYLTDKDDVLSFECELEHGWTLGYYPPPDENGDYGDITPIGDDDYLYSEVKCSHTAVDLVMRGIALVKGLHDAKS